MVRNSQVWAQGHNVTDTAVRGMALSEPFVFTTMPKLDILSTLCTVGTKYMFSSKLSSFLLLQYSPPENQMVISNLGPLYSSGIST